MNHYPIFIALKDQPCLIVGGGEVAARKIRLMLKANARITVVAPELCNTIKHEMLGDIIHQQRVFQDNDIQGYRLITAATNDENVNKHISELAQAQNIPVNVVDKPELCSFITPSIVDRSPVIIAISTGGGAPVLARMLRSKLEAFIPASYGRLAAVMQSFRKKIKQKLPEESQRREFWEQIVNGPVAEYFFSGQDEAGKQLLEANIKQHDKKQHSGEVWLIGAGPGDPDLLTFRALRLMQQADVVLYDRLVSNEILELCRRDAERIYVGKKRDQHTVAQPKINQLLIELAQQGKRVARLKGGDPFIFGRGGEEIEQLATSDIPFQVVPGITAANGCSTYAGIPLTHRDYAQSCVFVTGHLKNNSIDLNWQQLAIANQTVVIYMGLIGLPIICKKLIEHGVNKNMSTALIEQGTTKQQKVHIGTLSNMPEIIANTQVKAPTLIIIGEVVKLHKTLAWRENNI